MKYDFDTVYDRHHTNCAKYDSGHTDDPDMIPMWVADMDFKILPDIPEALSKRVSDGIYGYSTIPEEYLESVVGWMKRRHDFHVEKDWIVPTPGVVTAFHLAVEAYTKKDESVLVLTPVYYPFYRAIKNNGRRMVRMPLDLKDNQYTLDYKAFETKIIEENVKMMIFCNPHNPVGKVWTKEELKTIGDICKKHNVFVVSDEIHMDFVYAPHKHTAFYEVDPEYKNFSIVLTITSISKGFCIKSAAPFLRASIILAFCPAAVTIIILASGSISIISLTASIPPRTGIVMSIVVISGLYILNFSTPSAPLTASATISCPACSSIFLKNFLEVLESSTIKIFAIIFLRSICL